MYTQVQRIQVQFRTSPFEPIPTTHIYNHTITHKCKKLRRVNSPHELSYSSPHFKQSYTEGYVKLIPIYLEGYFWDSPFYYFSIIIFFFL